MAGALPSGRVTFAFTDVVGSTRAFFAHGERFAEALGALQARIAASAHRHGGVVVKTEGDGALLAFADADGAVACLREIQGDVTPLPGGLKLPLRAGAHTGEAIAVDGDYVSLAIHVAARIAAAAGAGQVLASTALIKAATDARATPVGEFLLRDIPEPVTLWRLTGGGEPPRAVAARRTNVPAATSSFFGRQVEIDELRRLTESPGVCTVVGPGGVGKTRIVSEFALAESTRFPGGAWLVELASVSAGAQLPEAIATGLGLPGAVALSGIAAELHRRGPTVMILDNCEHVIDAAAELVTDLLARCPSLRLIATSRESLDIPDERVLRLPPLSCRGGPASESEQLFRSRAQAAGVDLSPREPGVSELCRLLDGLPMALELAAARAADLPVPVMLDSLRTGGLAMARRGGLARQRSLDALVGWSLGLLEPHQLDVLLVLSLLPVGFDHRLAAAMVEAVPGLDATSAGAIIAQLTRSSLIDVDRDQYRILFVIRTVARRRLEARPDLYERAQQRLFEHLLEQVCDPGLLVSRFSLEPPAAAGPLLEVAIAWGLARAMPGTGRLVVEATRWAASHSFTVALQHLFQQALDGSGPPSERVLLQAVALRASRGGGSVGGQAPLPGWSLEAVLRLIDAARALPEPADALAALAALGNYLVDIGATATALEIFTERLELARGDPVAEAWALGDIGVLHHHAGRLTEAERFYRQAVVPGDQIPAYATFSASNLGEVLLDQDAPGEAVSVLARVVRSGVPGSATSLIATALLVEGLLACGQELEARTLAPPAETLLSAAVAADPSLQYYLDRFRAATESLRGRRRPQTA